MFFPFFKVPTTSYGTTSMFSAENGMNVSELGLTMINRVPFASSEMPNTN